MLNNVKLHKIECICTLMVEIHFYVVIVNSTRDLRREIESKFSHSTTFAGIKRGSSLSPFSKSSLPSRCLEHNMQSRYFWLTSKLFAASILLGRSLLHVSGKKKVAKDPKILIAPKTRRGSSVWNFAWKERNMMRDWKHKN